MGLFDYTKEPLKGYLPEHARTIGPREDVSNRFMIAQNGKPSQEQLDFQAEVRQDILKLAQKVNCRVEDSREKSLGLTDLEQALMWFGKAIFK